MYAQRIALNNREGFIDLDVNISKDKGAPGQ